MDPVTKLAIIDGSVVDADLCRVFKDIFHIQNRLTVIHYIGRIVKKSKHNFTDDFVLIVSDQAMYIYRPDGALKRCIAIRQVAEVLIFPDNYHMFRVPEEYDLVFKLANTAEFDYLLNILRVIQDTVYGRILKISGRQGTYKDYNPKMSKPDNYVPRTIPFTTVKELDDREKALENMLKPPPPPEKHKCSQSVKHLSQGAAVILKHPLLDPDFKVQPADPAMYGAGSPTMQQQQQGSPSALADFQAARSGRQNNNPKSNDAGVPSAAESAQFNAANTQLRKLESIQTQLAKQQSDLIDRELKLHQRVQHQVSSSTLRNTSSTSPQRAGPGTSQFAIDFPRFPGDGHRGEDQPGAAQTSRPNPVTTLWNNEQFSPMAHQPQQQSEGVTPASGRTPMANSLSEFGGGGAKAGGTAGGLNRSPPSSSHHTLNNKPTSISDLSPLDQTSTPYRPSAGGVQGFTSQQHQQRQTPSAATPREPFSASSPSPVAVAMAHEAADIAALKAQVEAEKERARRAEERVREARELKERRSNTNNAVEQVADEALLPTEGAAASVGQRPTTTSRTMTSSSSTAAAYYTNLKDPEANAKTPEPSSSSAIAAANSPSVADFEASVKNRSLKERLVLREYQIEQRRAEIHRLMSQPSYDATAMCAMQEQLQDFIAHLHDDVAELEKLEEQQQRQQQKQEPTQRGGGELFAPPGQSVGAPTGFPSASVESTTPDVSAFGPAVAAATPSSASMMMMPPMTPEQQQQLYQYWAWMYQQQQQQQQSQRQEGLTSSSRQHRHHHHHRKQSPSATAGHRRRERTSPPPAAVAASSSPLRRPSGRTSPLLASGRNSPVRIELQQHQQPSTTRIVAPQAVATRPRSRTVI